MLDDIGYQVDDKIELKLNGRFTRVCGRCDHNRRSGKYTIQIQKNHFLYSDENSVLDTLTHEYIHTLKDCFDHGDKFQSICDKMNKKFGMNLSTKSKVDEEFSKFKRLNSKYIVSCKNNSCNMEYFYNRKQHVVNYIEQYKCGFCKSDLKLSVRGE